MPNIVFPPPVAPITDKPMTPIWLNWCNNIYKLLGGVINTSPVISSGIVAPTSTPAKVGNMYVDTTHTKIYIATGTSSSANWTIVN